MLPLPHHAVPEIIQDNDFDRRVIGRRSLEFADVHSDTAVAIYIAGSHCFPGFGQLTPQPQCLDNGTGATVGYDPLTDACPVGSEAATAAAREDWRK